MNMDTEVMPKKPKLETANQHSVESDLFTDISEQANAFGLHQSVLISPKLLIALMSAPEELVKIGETDFIRLSRIFLSLSRHLKQQPKETKFNISVLLPTQDALIHTIVCRVDKSKVTLLESDEPSEYSTDMKQEVGEAAKHLLPAKVWRERGILTV